jgi:hypothetical protein
MITRRVSPFRGGHRISASYFGSAANHLPEEIALLAVASRSIEQQA